MSHDETESTRRQMLADDVPERDAAATRTRWDTDALARDFTVLAFLAPFVIVQRRSDGRKGSMEFTHSPRVYFNFQPDDQKGA